MTLDDILADLPQLAEDAISVAYRPAGSPGARFVFVNRAFLKLFGYAEEEVIGTEVEIVHDPEHWEEFISKVAPRFVAGEKSFTAESSCMRKTGETFWSSMAFTMIDDDESDGRFSMVLFRDISDLKNREIAAERALEAQRELLADLRQAQQRLVSAIETVPDPFAIYDAEDRLVMWNPAFAESVSDDPGDLTRGMHMGDVFRLACENGRFANAGADVAEVLSQRGDIDRRGLQFADIEMTGDRHFRLLRSLAPNGDLVAVRVNMTEVVRKERELEKYAQKLEQANTEISKKVLLDELTQLGNRRHLTEEFNRMLARRRQSGGELAALHIDLDRFKQINDTRGHAGGDFVLREVAKRLQGLIGPKDVAARIGGDEFFVLMPIDAESRRPEELAERLVTELAAPVHFEGKECRFGASVGLARTPAAMAEDLLTNSDIALYKAKNSGRARVGYFEHVDLLASRESKKLTDDLLRGLERREIVPFYQPQVDARSGKVVALEALARWRHPEDGILAPDRFVEIADDLGILDTIDQQVFEQAIDECAAAFRGWRAPPSLSFNVSGKRLAQENYASIADWVAVYPGQLNFELLESIFFEEEGEAFFMQIDALRELGINFELDDYGSGNSTLVALRQVAPERMKIDRRLVFPITDSDDARRLVEWVVGIGLALGLGVTAEGVETAEHARVLTEMGCDRLQGFHFSRPVPLHQLMAQGLLSESAA